MSPPSRPAAWGALRRDAPRRDLAILALGFLLSLPLVTPRIYASDEVQYFSYLRSLWFDHDVSFENEYRHFYESGVTRYDGFHETFLERETVTGRRETFATVGSAILWSPFYAVADVLTRAGLTGAPADGYSKPYVAAVAYGSAVYGWLAVVSGWWMARRLGAGAGALPAALAVWMGTPLFFYMYIAPPMSHACSAVAVAAFLATWIVVRERWSIGGCAALGALAALLAMVREQDVFVAIAPGLDWAWTLARPQASRHPDLTSRRLLGGGTVFALAFGLCYLPQLAAYVTLNGYPGPSRLVARKMNWMAPHALGVLASPRHGLLAWTPLVLVALLGLVAAVRGGLHAADALGRVRVFAPIVAASLLAAVALQVFVAGSVESWTVAGAFGQRRFVGLSAIILVGLAVVWQAARTRATAARAAAALVFVLGVWWNLGLMAQFGSGLMDRQRLELGRNAYHTFITVPARLPELAYRYLFERSTFFARPAS